MKKTAPIFLAAALSVCGCTPQQQILEELQLIKTIGYDYVNDEMILGTGGSTSIPPGQQSLPADESFSAAGYTSKQIRQKLQNESTKPIVIGRVGVVLFSENLAEHGISRLLDNLQRDPEIGRDIYLALAESSAKQIINGKYSGSIPTSNYIFDLIQQSMKQSLPKINLHGFLYRYYGKGLDAFMPIVRQADGKLMVTGIGIFKGDKLVQLINTEDAYYLKMTSDKIKKGILEIKYKGENLSIENLFSKPHVKIINRNGQYEAELTLKIKGKISEGAGLRMTSQKVMNGVERVTAEKVEKKLNQLVESFRENQVDPIGFKRKAMQSRSFSKKKWDQQYAEMPVRVHTDVTILHAGIME
ncbi:Ger(x)C family spore germination protein [Bacillus sp. FJAT-42376]|uniref:Ger(x)C family spore germination protein n=1 Tax=Bacillus sp. FJAT-42376 TaxID=2014076 RepID=UPI000F4F1021|nr:Ger(x)C family spore germination protein [Bacillus sp. FJAT-42376]AZB43096.1 Ger(x)C family spore germination protein [Bacillus sp. FJAT-42376]